MKTSNKQALDGSIRVLVEEFKQLTAERNKQRAALKDLNK